MSRTAADAAAPGAGGAAAARPRVAMVLTRMDVGGVPDHVLSLFEGLRGRVDFTLVCDHVHPDHRPVLADLGVAVVETPMRRGPAPLADLRALVRLVGLLRAGGFDVAHTHMSKAALLGALAGLFLPRLRVVNTAHNLGFIALRSAVLRAAFRVYDRLLFALGCHLVIFVSATVAARAVAAGVTPARKVRVIPNGLRAARFAGPHPTAAALRAGWLADPARDALVVCVARLVWFKGLHVLIAAFARLRPAHPGARLLIVGAGELRAALAAQAAQLGVGGAVIFAGERSDVPAVLAAADVFALSSVSEGLPISILEAMASGLSVVSTAVGGAPELVADGVTGRLVPPEDPPALAAALDALLADPALRAAMGRAGQARWRRDFSQAAMVAATEDVYRALAGLPAADGEGAGEDGDAGERAAGERAEGEGPAGEGPAGEGVDWGGMDGGGARSNGAGGTEPIGPDTAGGGAAKVDPAQRAPAGTDQRPARRATGGTHAAGDGAVGSAAAAKAAPRPEGHLTGPGAADADRPSPDRPNVDRSGPDLPKADRPSPCRQNADRPSAAPLDADQPSADRAGPDLPSPDLPSPDLPSPDRPSADRPSADRPGATRAPADPGPPDRAGAAQVGAAKADPGGGDG